MSNKKEREKRREERLAEEAKVDTGDRRTRLLQIGAGAVFLAIVAVVVVIVVAGSSSDSGGDAQNLKEISEVDSLVQGIPQAKLVLGDTKAPVELIEYGDLQCPVCKQYSEEILPPVVEKQVKEGKAKVIFRNFLIIGPDSLPAGAAAIAAGNQGKGWTFLELFYRNQGEENSGYVTDDFLTKVLTGAGADADKAIAAAGSPAASQQIAEAKTLADKHGVEATPTILVGPTGGDLKKDTESQPTAAGIGQLVDAAAKAGT
jgi:protein-disulfide isomerase